MWKTILAVAVLVAATLWVPLWVQLALYGVAVVFTPYRLALFIPAAIADALYAPGTMWQLGSHWYVLFVGALLVVHWIVVHKTRIGQLAYGVEA
jgi:hypothetical protein